MKKYDIIDDYLKSRTNRCLGKLLQDLGNSINEPQIKLIKYHLRLFEDDIRKYISNIEKVSYVKEQNL